MTKTGAGFLTLSGNNSFSGTTTVNTGNLAYASALALSPSSSIVLNSPGAINVSGPYTTVTGWLGSGLINQNATARLGPDRQQQRDDQHGPGQFLHLQQPVTGASLGGATYSGTLTPSATTYYLGGGGGPLTFTPSITGANGLVSASTLILTGSNSYTGPTTINSGGTLQFGGRGELEPQRQHQRRRRAGL